MKVDFSNIVVRDINGQEQKADVRQMLGNMLYMQGNNIDECELGQAIYHQEADAPIELPDKQCDIIRQFAQRLPYVMRQGLLGALKQ